MIHFIFVLTPLSLISMACAHRIYNIHVISRLDIMRTNSWIYGSVRSCCAKKQVSSGSSLHQLLSRSSFHTRLPCRAECLAVDAAFAGLAGALPPSLNARG